MKVKNPHLKILEYLHLSFNKWPSIQYKFWVSLVLWKHNNVEHCWLGNGPEDNHWHTPQSGKVTEGHYWKGWLFKSAVLKHIKCKVKENEHKQQGWPQAWEYCQAKPIQTIGRASQGVNWSWSQCIKLLCSVIFRKRLPSHFWDRKIIRSILPGLRRKITGLLLRSKVLFSDKIKFCFSFGNQSLESEERLERHRIQDAWSPVWSFWSQWWFGVPWRQLVLVHCVLSSPKSIQPSTRRFWSILCLHLLASFMEMLISFFQQDFSTCPQCQKHVQVVCWPWYYCACLARQHAWPEPHLESMGYFQEKDEKQWIQQCRRAEGCATGYCIGKQRHRLIASMPHLTDAGVCAKGAQTKYWVHKLKDFIELELVWLANPFCINLRKYSNILRYWFLTFMSCKL